jgi:hypothetical protein
MVLDDGGAPVKLLVGKLPPDEGVPPPFRGCDGGLLADGEMPPPVEKPAIRVSVPPIYTREAFEHRVAGVGLARCILEVDGSLTECRMIQSLPYFDESILAMLSHWAYTPITWCGEPQRVEMTIPIKISMGPRKESQ